MALPTFDEFKTRLCSDEFGCTYEERRVECPPLSGRYITGGVFRLGKTKMATFVRDDIGARMDVESICSILSRLVIPGEKFDVKCRKA